ncbi:purine/pyrimidine permease [Rhizobium sp. VS19-DR104.2]|uniref:uracil-xanthine permease family protein n=1 Tax=unclassified Rhizobium TaxID=2613769 RepID=UPI001CC75DD2|nr:MULTISPECIES: solute carrier family 23 protein [unclassified Rhizobium]MBZ5762221.1 purine/pyrimidine permease [Rhizobium sp. VS19-DR96]MBZ5768237.1 purine/pyrimidine permease [Rhizobium sp. VS19-DR129.2]MBZ5775891.1 purine/pyrimidine permease [Rhizobium sp. VS19-DRK62.2]MBZ5787088.1 purine/pyrimidine permease [Rhizobium sp. VS19-DR121]MBZ5804162.1 purine/pyrimidine permease [Rhizobium sp. VS19-DR181]
MKDVPTLTTDGRSETIGRSLAEEGGTAHEIANIRFGVDARLPALPMLTYAVQHVLIMFTAMITPPLLIGQLLDLPDGLRLQMLAGVMLGCGLGTLVSTLGLFGIGARLPLLLGAYAVYIGPVVVIAKSEGLPAAAGAMMTGAIFLLALSPLLGFVRRFFPPLIVGVLLVITGLSLIKIAVGVALGMNTPYQGNPLTFVFLIASVGAIAAIATTGRRWRSVAVLLTVLAAYALAFLCGLANLAGVFKAPWLNVPSLLPFGLTWPSAAGLSTILIYNVIAAVYTMSITIALCSMTGVQSSHGRVRAAVAGDGLGSVLSVLFGGLPLISYDQNVGAISLTGVASRYVVAVSGLIVIVMAFVPKFAALVSAVPPFVLGGTLIFMFGMIAAVGVKMLSTALRDQRDTIIVAATLGVSAASNLASSTAFDTLTPVLRILCSDGIVTGLVVSIALNAILPMSRKPFPAP